MRLDLFFFCLNALLFQNIITKIADGETAWFDRAVAGWRWALGLPGFHLGHSTDVAVLTLAEIIGYDLAFFLCHRAMHQVPLLWRLHKVHHSAVDLNPLTAFRNHPIDDVFFTVVTSFGALSAVAVCRIFITEPVNPYTFSSVNCLFFIFAMIAPLRHSDTKIGFGRFFDRIFISPHQHQVHHSTNPEHHNKNFALVFSVWDIIAGSHYRPDQNEDFVYGLGHEDGDYSTIIDLYLRPLKKPLQTDEIDDRQSRMLPPGRTP